MRHRRALGLLATSASAVCLLVLVGIGLAHGHPHVEVSVSSPLVKKLGAAIIAFIAMPGTLTLVFGVVGLRVYRRVRRRE